MKFEGRQFPKCVVDLPLFSFCSSSSVLMGTTSSQQPRDENVPTFRTFRLRVLRYWNDDVFYEITRLRRMRL